MAAFDALDAARDAYAQGGVAPGPVPAVQSTNQPMGDVAPQGGAMSGSVQVSQGTPAGQTFDYTTPFAMDRKTGELYAGGQKIPTDISAWVQVAQQDPSKISPMSRDAIQQHDLQPMSHDQLQDAISQIQKNATAPVLSNFFHSAANAARAIPGGIATTAGVMSKGIAAGLDKAGMHGVANFENDWANSLDSVSGTYGGMTQRADQSTRSGLTMQEQAGNDTSFGAHPGTYIAGRGSSMAGSAVPGVAAFVLNPALGAAAIGGQTGGQLREQTQQSVRSQLEAMKPEDLVRNPIYAQLRQGGMNDQEAKERMADDAGRSAGIVGMAGGVATAPFFGQLGASVVRQGTTAGLIPQVGGNFVVSALGRGALAGTEGTVLNEATQIPAQMAGNRTAGIGSNNPADYVHASDLAEGFLGMAVPGMLGRHTPNPVATAAASDMGAAAGAIHGGDARPAAPGWSTSPGVRDPYAFPDPGPRAPQAPADWTATPGAVDPTAPVQPRPAAPDAPPAWETQPGAAELPVAPQPGDAPGPTAPQAPNWDLDPQARSGNLANRRAQQAAELEARQRASEVNPPQLPSPGPTDAMQQRVASIQASLAGISSLLDGITVNKRTKSGRETLAKLNSERDRLTSELADAQNSVVGDEIGTARDARPAPVDRSIVGDPMSGQHELPGVQPPTDSRLTGELTPPGAGPGDSFEPKPINAGPMSQAEAAARLKAQNARNPANREPQEDLFPGQLKRELKPLAQPEQARDQAIAQSEQGASPSTPEPAADLQAQADRLGKGSDAVFVAKGNEAQMPTVRRGVRKVVRDEGTLFTTNAEKAKAYREAPVVDDALLAQMQDLPETKAAALKGGEPSVVAAEDAAGNVVKEAVGTPGGPNDAVVAAATPAGGRTVRRDSLTAQARRASKLQAEDVIDAGKPTRSRMDMIKDAAASKRAAPKKKVDEPVTETELSDRAPAARPEAIATAERELLDDVRENHPHLLDDAAPKPERKGPAGRTAESPLSRLPLTDREFSTLTSRTRATAEHEAAQIADGSWTARSSAVRRILDTMGLKARSDSELRKVVQDMATSDPKALAMLMRQLSHRLADSSLAKSIVRGADVVRAAVPDNDMGRRAGERDVSGGYDGMPLGSHVEEMRAPAGDRGDTVQPEVNEAASTARVKVYGKDVPGNVGDVVRGWLSAVEKNAPGVLPSNIHIMTPKEALARYPSLSVSDTATGFTGLVRGPKGTMEQVLAVDWHAYGDTPAALEIVGHEMGHLVSNNIFDKMPKEDQTAVKTAFEDWLQASGKGTPKEQMASRLSPSLADLVRNGNDPVDPAYAGSWKEWIADETSKWLFTSAKPKSVVDRFFAKIAQVLKDVWANTVGGGNPTQAVRDAMDRWVRYGQDQSLHESDRAARAGEMNYNRNPTEPTPAGEAARAKVDMNAVRQRAEKVVAGTKDLGTDIGDAITGDPGNLKRRLDHAVGSVAQGKAGDFIRSVSHAVSSMNDIVGRYGGTKNGEFGKALTDWDHQMRLAEKYSKEAQQQGQIAIEKALRLSEPVKKALQSLMYRATTYGIHPDMEFGKGKNAHLVDEDPSVTAANQRRYGELQSSWQALKGIQGDPQAVYKGLRESMAKLHEDTFDAKRDALDALPIADELKEQGHRMLNAQEERQLEGPYFPLVREGSYITTAVMPAKFIGEFETKAEADAAGRRAKALNPHAEVQIANVDGQWAVHTSERAVYFHPTLKDALNAKPSIEAEMREAWSHQQVGKAFDTMVKNETGEAPLISSPMTSVNFYRKSEVPQTGSFMHAVNKLRESGAIDPQAFKQLGEMYVESLPEFSPRKNMLTRENIRGADQNMLAGYSRRLMAAAHSYGQTKIAAPRNESWSRMYKHRGDRPDFGTVMSDIFNRQEILAKRMVHNPLNTFASTVQDASSFMSLAFSPAFAAQQIIQPVVLSLPVMAARMGANGKAVGYGKAMAALQQAYSDAPAFFFKRGGQQWAHEMKRILGTYGGDGQTLQESSKALIEKFGKTDDERHLLEYMNDRGTLDFSFLNAITDATTQSAAGAKAKSIMRLSMAFAQQIEAMNRTVTGLAAYRLAKAERGMSHEDAVREANTITSQTHGDYSRYNRPSVFNRPIVGMALQFKMYTQFMYSLLVSNVAHAMDPSLSKGERQQAVRTLGYVLGSHAVIGGAVGLGPVAAAAKLGLGAVMYGLAGAGMGDKKQKDQSMDDYIAQETEHYGDEMFGQGNGRALRKAGTYGLLGLMGTNMANKIAIPDLTDTRFTGKPLSERATPGDAIDKFALSSLGSVYSNGKRLANGTAELMHGNVKDGAAQLLPAAPRALLNAATEAQDGVVTGSGHIIKNHDDMNPYDTFIRAIGLNTADTDMRYGDRGRVLTATDRINSARLDLLEAYRKADPEDRSAVMDDIADFNRGRAKELQISAASLSRAVSAKGQQPGKEEQAVRRAIGVRP